MFLINFSKDVVSFYKVQKCCLILVVLDGVSREAQCFRDFIEVELEFVDFPRGSFVVELDLAFVVVLQSLRVSFECLVDPYDLVRHLGGDDFDSKHEEQTEDNCYIEQDEQRIQNYTA